MPYEIKHFGTSGEIRVIIDEVNQWLNAQSKIDIITMSESQGGQLGSEADPFYFSLNIVYKRTTQ